MNYLNCNKNAHSFAVALLSAVLCLLVVESSLVVGVCLSVRIPTDLHTPTLHTFKRH